MSDDELVHMYHCNPETALCGADLRDGMDCAEDDGAMCVVCMDLLPLKCEDVCPVAVFS